MAEHPRSTFNTLALIAYIALALFTLCLFMLFKTRLIGWLVGLPCFGLSAAAQFTIVKKGCATGFILFFVTMAALLCVFLLFTDTSSLMG